MSDLVPVGYPTIPDLTDPNFVGANQRNLDDLRKLLGTAVAVTHTVPFVEVGVGSGPAFANSWVNYGGAWAAAKFVKDPFGYVHISGAVKSGSLSATIFTLPAGYRPAADLSFPAWAQGNVLQEIYISSAGLVQIYGTADAQTRLSLCGMSFRTDE